LEKHHKFFQEIPKGFPPSRDHEYQIELIPRSTPPNKRPYSYPRHQKGEIEKSVQDMLDASIIQQTKSSFSTPVVMVRIKDNSWRMCPDCRYLNKITIKDKLPIPNIDELLNELHGVAYFTKLDMKSGYHQIILRKEDIPKIAFRTRDKKYEILVMPFWLTNVPSTFQSLMKKKIQPHLKKFVLVFFDDILFIANHGKNILNMSIKS